MKRNLGKWEQNVLLRQHPLVAKHLPETTVYSEKNLDDLLRRHQSVYVKHDSTGQGRAIVNIRKSRSGHYNVNGFTIQGKPIRKSVSRVDEIQQILHPFIKFDRKSGLYIIQEDIQTHTLNGQPFSIRVHIQKLKNNWVIGVMKHIKSSDYLLFLSNSSGSESILLPFNVLNYWHIEREEYFYDHLS